MLARATGDSPLAPPHIISTCMHIVCKCVYKQEAFICTMRTLSPGFYNIEMETYWWTIKPHLSKQDKVQRIYAVAFLDYIFYGNFEDPFGMQFWFSTQPSYHRGEKWNRNREKIPIVHQKSVMGSLEQHLFGAPVPRMFSLNIFVKSLPTLYESFDGYDPLKVFFDHKEVFL